MKVSSGISYLDRTVFLNLLCAEMLDKRKENGVDLPMPDHEDNGTPDISFNANSGIGGNDDLPF